MRARCECECYGLRTKLDIAMEHISMGDEMEDINLAKDIVVMPPSYCKKPLSEVERTKLRFKLSDVGLNYKVTSYEEECLDLIFDNLLIFMQSILQAMADEKRAFVIGDSIATDEKEDVKRKGLKVEKKENSPPLSPWDGFMNWSYFTEEEAAHIKRFSEKEKARLDRRRKKLDKENEAHKCGNCSKCGKFHEHAECEYCGKCYRCGRCQECKVYDEDEICINCKLCKKCEKCDVCRKCLRCGVCYNCGSFHRSEKSAASDKEVNKSKEENKDGKNEFAEIQNSFIKETVFPEVKYSDSKVDGPFIFTLDDLMDLIVKSPEILPREGLSDKYLELALEILNPQSKASVSFPYFQ